MSAAYERVGGLQQALDRTRDYLKQRRAFGRALIDNQHLAFQLAELNARLDMLRHYNYACADAYMRGEDTTRFATVAKLIIGRLSRDVAATCLQHHGGIGYMEETWTARFLRDMTLTSIGGGADEVMLQVLTKLDGLHS
jgi:citronellyl-CoA dehydrogenase